MRQNCSSNPLIISSANVVDWRDKKGPTNLIIATVTGSGCAEIAHYICLSCVSVHAKEKLGNTHKHCCIFVEAADMSCLTCW